MSDFIDRHVAVDENEKSFAWQDARVFVAAPEQMLGRAIVGALARRRVVTLPIESDLDLSDSRAVDAVFSEWQPTHIFLAAGRKGGILANQRYPADLMFDNLRVQLNVMQAALHHDVQRLLYVGSACLYPRDCQQPMQEDSLLTGQFEATNASYSVSKLAGLQLCHAIQEQHGMTFVATIPTNIFGPYDDFDPDNAHVVGALIHRIAIAKQESQSEVVIWGSGTPRREFLFADDFGEAAVFLMERYQGRQHINIGLGSVLSIRELAVQVKQALGFEGALRFDSSRPDGMPNKVVDSSRLADLGWRPKYSFAEGLRRTCQWHQQHVAAPVES